MANTKSQKDLRDKWMCTGWQYLHAESRHALHVLLVEVSLALILTLSQRNIQRFRDQDPTVHLCDGFCCFLRWAEANEAEPLRATSFVHHLKTNISKVHSTRNDTRDKKYSPEKKLVSSKWMRDYVWRLLAQFEYITTRVKSLEVS